MENENVWGFANEKCRIGFLVHGKAFVIEISIKEFLQETELILLADLIVNFNYRSVLKATEEFFLNSEDPIIVEDIFKNATNTTLADLFKTIGLNIQSQGYYDEIVDFVHNSSPKDFGDEDDKCKSD